MENIKVHYNGAGFFRITHARPGVKDKFLEFNTREAIEILKGLRSELKRQKKLDIKNFGYYQSLDDH